MDPHQNSRSFPVRRNQCKPQNKSASESHEHVLIARWVLSVSGLAGVLEENWIDDLEHRAHDDAVRFERLAYDEVPQLSWVYHGPPLQTSGPVNCT